MSPLKIAIASLLVGLIGLTASAMENAESSSASPHETERRPLTEGLTIGKVRKNLNLKEMRVYSKRLRDLAWSEAGYRFKDKGGNWRTHALADPEYLREKIYDTESQVLERMQGGQSSSASPHATERRPLTEGLTIGKVRKNLNPKEMRVYSRRLTELAWSEGGYRFKDEGGNWRTHALAYPEHLREKIYDTESQVLERMQRRRSEQGGAQAEQGGAQAEQGGAQAEQGGAQAEQGGAQAEGEELDGDR